MSPANFEKINEKVFVDIPSSAPAIKIKLAKVGVTNRPITLSLASPFLNTPVVLPCRITVFSSLKAHQRGLHMSRIEEALDELRESGATLSDFVSSLANLVCKTQDQEECSISLEADYEHRVSKNVSGKSSIELLKLHASAELKSGKLCVTQGISAPFINACPCTQRWGMREFFNTLKTKGYSDQEATDLTKCAPLQAHTNRGTATILISSTDVSLVEIYKVLDRAVPIIRELLKGPDEHAVVTATHRAGQFCEDNIRAILNELHTSMSHKVAPATELSVNVEVDESVHFHNLSGEYTGSFGELAESIS
jgi:GTP cyclohydrolase I